MLSSSEGSVSSFPPSPKSHRHRRQGLIRLKSVVTAVIAANRIRKSCRSPILLRDSYSTVTGGSEGTRSVFSTPNHDHYQFGAFSPV